MEFKAISSFIVVTNCLNYQIRKARAGDCEFFSCYRATEVGFENIDENGRSYPLYVLAKNRILEVHNAEPELAKKIDPDARVKSSKAVARDAIESMRAMLRA